MDISVIIPTYKPGDYIFECLDSLLKQQTTVSFEIIVVLNGCNEPFYDTINSYISENKIGIDIILLQTDMPGVSYARNMAIGESNGDFLTFIDDDDIVSECFLQELFTNSSRDTVGVANVKAFKGNIENINDDYHSVAFNKHMMTSSVIKSKISMRKFLSNAWPKLISKDIVGGNEFNTKVPIAEDSLFMIQISKNISCIKLTSPDSIYYRRIRTESATRAFRSSFELTKIYTYLIGKCLSFSIMHPLRYNHILIIIKISAMLRSYLIRCIWGIK